MLSIPLSYITRFSGWGRHRTDDLRLFRPALLPSELPNQVMSVERLELPTSAFVARRSQVPTELHGQSQDGRIRTCVSLLPRQVGDRCPTS